MSGGNYLWSNFPGPIIQGAIIRGKIFLGGGTIFLEGNCPGGAIFLGGNCLDTVDLLLNLQRIKTSKDSKNYSIQIYNLIYKELQVEKW